MKLFPNVYRIALLLIILLVSIAGAILISDGDLIVRYSTDGLHGGVAEGGGYSARFLLTEKTGGNAQGDNYMVHIGFFSAPGLQSGTTFSISLQQGWNLISLPLSI